MRPEVLTHPALSRTIRLICRTGNPAVAPQLRTSEPIGERASSKHMEGVEGQPCCGKPSLKPFPRRVFCLVRRVPCLKSLSGYGEARGIRRKRKRRPDCTFPTTLWLEARRAQRMQAQNRSAPDASGGSSPPGSAAGSRAVQDGAMCRKALMVVQHAVRRLPEGNLSGSIQAGKVLKVALERPKALACPSVS